LRGRRHVRSRGRASRGATAYPVKPATIPNAFAS
jgi:hypothetical protein